MANGQYIHIHVDEVLRDTEKAMLVRIGDEELWLPFSQIADDCDPRVGDVDLTISVTEWIAKKNGLEKFEG